MNVDIDGLYDFSTEISDNENITVEKIKKFFPKIQIEKIFIKEFYEMNLKVFYYEIPYGAKNLTLTLWGGGTSGIKISNLFAAGGNSSGIILRYPISLEDNSYYYLECFIGEGGKSFKIIEDTPSLVDGQFWNNGNPTLCRLKKSSTSFKEKNFSTNQSDEDPIIEEYISYGALMIPNNEPDDEGNYITYINSTNMKNFYSFDGLHNLNTNISSIDTSWRQSQNYDIMDGYSVRYIIPNDNRNFNGYPSFIGNGGSASKTAEENSDADINSGAGGGGVINNSSATVGAGGNGGIIVEFESDNVGNLFIPGFFSLQKNENFLTFILYDISDKILTESTIVFNISPYDTNTFLNYFQELLNSSFSNFDNFVVSKNSTDNLSIKSTNYKWNIDYPSSSTLLLRTLGIPSSDLLTIKPKNQTHSFTNKIFQYIESNILDSV
jgi:hypothetical protein